MQEKIKDISFRVSNNFEWPTPGLKQERIGYDAPSGMEASKRIKRLVQPYNGQLRLKTR